jgi:hypothetical protein
MPAGAHLARAERGPEQGVETPPPAEAVPRSWDRRDGALGGLGRDGPGAAGDCPSDCPLTRE